MSDVSKLVKSICKNGNFTQAEAAKLIGVHPLTVSRWSLGVLGAHKLTKEKLVQLDAHIKTNKK